jgi:hypothetical protein
MGVDTGELVGELSGVLSGGGIELVGGSCSVEDTGVDVGGTEVLLPKLLDGKVVGAVSSGGGVVSSAGGGVVSSAGGGVVSSAGGGVVSSAGGGEVSAGGGEVSAGGGGVLSSQSKSM